MVLWYVMYYGVLEYGYILIDQFGGLFLLQNLHTELNVL